jgi:hypothetical protein
MMIEEAEELRLITAKKENEENKYRPTNQILTAYYWKPSLSKKFFTSLSRR